MTEKYEVEKRTKWECPEDGKRCSRCRDVLPLSSFTKNKSKKDGLATYCRECRKQYNLANAEKRRAYYLANRKSILEKQSKYGKLNREKIYERRKDYFREYVATHRAQRAEYFRRWRVSKKDDAHYKQLRHQQGVRYRKKHHDEIANKKREQSAKRRAEDPVYRLKGQVRGMIRDSFRRHGLKKSETTEKILGCSLDFFQEYLLDTWEKRYGYKWNGEACDIDHIIPLASADTVEKVIELCNYKNLQLLTPEDNRKKWF